VNFPSILALASCVALLIGLLGGEGKARELEVPHISQKIRVISAGIGVILIGISLWLFLSDSQSFFVKANPTVADIPTSAAVNTMDGAFETRAPVLVSVVFREDLSKGSLILYQDVSYYDLDGDVEYVDWSLVSTTKESNIVSDGQIYDSMEQQKEGAVFTAVWHCTGGEYPATVQAVLVDKEGNKSEPLEYNLLCR